MNVSIPIPDRAKVLIKSGQQIDVGTPLYEQEIRKETSIFISQKIDVAPQKIFNHLKKLVGDSIQKGEVLAEKKSLLGSKQYVSEYSGTLKEVNHVEGSVLIDIYLGEEEGVTSNVKGTIDSIKGGFIQVKLQGVKEYPAKEATHTWGGKAVYLAHDPDLYDEEKINGYIVVAEKIKAYHEAKFEALGARGFILLHSPTDSCMVPHAVFKQIKDYTEVQKHHAPYCYIEEKKGTIIFYS